MKKTLILVAAVVFAHCVVISALVLVQGCKSTQGMKGSTTTPMPPMSAPSAAPAKGEAAPVVKEFPGEETFEYVVKSGDSLGTIAKKHNVRRAELIDLNKLADPNKIRVGQKLIIPKRDYMAAPSAAKTHEAKPKAKKSEPAPGPAKEPASLAKGINEYVVQAGDSMSKVASKFNVKIGELREVNKLVSDKLKVGQKLVIPGKSAEKAPEAAPAAAEPAAAAAPAKSETPAATPAATPAPAAKGSGITHVVLPNEDLNSIAKLYVVSADDIATANQLGTNRTVQAGQKIIIPQP